MEPTWWTEVYELVTWKKAVVEGVERYWKNSFHFASPVAISKQDCYRIAHNITVAEQFLLRSNVYLMGRLVRRIDRMKPHGALGGIYIMPASSYGLAGEHLVGELLPWRFALTLKKEAEEGRSAQMCYRQCLSPINVTPWKGKGWALINSQPYGPHATTLIMHWFNDVPIPHAIFKRENEVSYPTEVRRVSRLSIGGVTSLQSIEDAQARKTLAAKPFEEKYYKLVERCFEAARQMELLRRSHPDGMLKADAEGLAAYASILKSQAELLKDYWKPNGGLMPMLQLNWRPTAGLDPASQIAHMLLIDMIAEFEKLGEIFDEMMTYPEEAIPYEFSEPFAQQLLYIISGFEAVGVCRWTGTPINPTLGLL